MYFIKAILQIANCFGIYMSWIDGLLSCESWLPLMKEKVWSIRSTSDPKSAFKAASSDSTCSHWFTDLQIKANNTVARHAAWRNAHTQLFCLLPLITVSFFCDTYLRERGAHRFPADTFSLCSCMAAFQPCWGIKMPALKFQQWTMWTLQLTNVLDWPHWPKAPKWMEPH